MGNYGVRPSGKKSKLKTKNNNNKIRKNKKRNKKVNIMTLNMTIIGQS